METQVECLRIEGCRAVAEPGGPVVRISARAVPALRGVEVLVIPPEVEAFYGLNRFENLRVVEYGGTADVFAFQDSLDWLTEKLAEPEVSMAMTNSLIRRTSLYSSGSTRGILPYRDRP